nr:MAG TPA: hypothetical protein [Caudoviricetes sp.]
MYAYLIKPKGIAFELILADFGQSITTFLAILCEGLPCCFTSSAV